MKINLNANGYEQHKALFVKTVQNRIRAEFVEGGIKVTLGVEPSLGSAESYQIRPVSDGWQITGSDELGLYFGIGKFLHTAVWKNDEFLPAPPEGIKTPACSFRAMYFPFHHYQWYHMAPMEELEDYVEQMLLWGYNAIVCITPNINVASFEEEAFVTVTERVRTLFRCVKRYGMKTGTIICPNQGNKSAPEELNNDPNFNQLMRGNKGRNICPNKPGAIDYLRTIWRGSALEPLADIGLDYIITWPYDEGGCGCAKCRPWGANGYLDTCIALRDEALKIYPDVKFIVSTWAYDDPDDEGEYAGLYNRLAGDIVWADYLMIDAHRDFPQYPLEHPVIKPIVNFPEISMWGLAPWGGFGANPLPKRFQRIWDSSKSILSGGMPYSEGIYEDILKVQCSGYYWEPDKHYRDILAEYINYEYSADVVKEVLEIMEGIEENHVLVAGLKEPDLERALHVAQLAEQVNNRLTEQVRCGWKWKLLYIRAILDKKRYQYFHDNNMKGEADAFLLRKHSADFLTEDREAQEMLRELVQWYHMNEEKQNWNTLPQVGGSKYPKGDETPLPAF